MVFKKKKRPNSSSQNCRFFAEEARWFFEVSEITKTNGAKINLKKNCPLVFLVMYFFTKNS
jgi:hypothetical protein